MVFEAEVIHTAAPLVRQALDRLARSSALWAEAGLRLRAVLLEVEVAALLKERDQQ